MTNDGSDIYWGDELEDPDFQAPGNDLATTGATHLPVMEKGDGATPFQAGYGYSPRFPTRCLPPKMRDYVHDIATRAQVPVDLPALVMLGLIGAASAPRIMVRASMEWMEPTNLYAMCGMASSAGKSPALKEIKRGTWRADETLKRAHAVAVAKRIDQLNIEADTLETDLNHNRVTIGMEEKAGIEAQIKALRAEVTKLVTDPPLPPLMVLDGDTTPEALANKLSSTGGQGAIVDDEGTLLSNLGGQYSGGRTANLGIFLKGYDCDAYRPSRITREARPIDRVSLGLILAPQPSFVADMMRNGAMRDSGFVNRFLVALPGDLLGRRVGRRSTFVGDGAHPAQADRSLALWWEALLDSIVQYPTIESNRESETGAVLDLSREAYDMHAGYVEDFEPRLRAGRGNLAKVANWAGKHCGRVLRIANALHLAAGWTTDDRISKDTMADAITIGEWAIEHFLGMGKVVGLTTGAAQIKEYIDNIPSGWCTRTDINNKVFNRKGGADNMSDWFDELVGTGLYVREFLSSGRGRPVEIVRLVDAVVDRD